jgi:anti-anti-sigma factor
MSLAGYPARVPPPTIMAVPAVEPSSRGSKLMSTRPSSFTLGTQFRPEHLLTLRLPESGPVTVIEVVGDLDIATAHLLTEFVEAALHPQPPMIVVLDLAGLRFFCAAGVGALLQVRDAAAAHAAQLILRDPSPITSRILTVTDMLDVFQIKTNLANA